MKLNLIAAVLLVVTMIDVIILSIDYMTIGFGLNPFAGLVVCAVCGLLLKALVAQIKTDLGYSSAYYRI